MLLLSLAAGLAALYLGAEWLVKGACRAALGLKVSPLVIGLTVVAFGTSMPEMVASVVAAWNGSTDIVLGNVFGSNIANVGLILGLAGLLRTVPVHRALLWREIPFMLLTTVVVYALAATGTIGRLLGVVLFAGLVLFTVLALQWARQEKSRAALEQQRLAHEVDLSGDIRMRTEIGRIAVGLLLLSFGADLLVDAAVELARLYGVSEFLVSVTMVALGTSLPELATSIVAVLRGESDVLVGNLVGSNIFNLLGALGAGAMIRALPVSPAIVAFDLPAVLVFSLAMTIFLFTGRAVVRWEGALLLLGYAAYIALSIG